MRNAGNTQIQTAIKQTGNYTVHWGRVRHPSLRRSTARMHEAVAELAASPVQTHNHAMQYHLAFDISPMANSATRRALAMLLCCFSLRIRSSRRYVRKSIPQPAPKEQDDAAAGGCHSHAFQAETQAHYCWGQANLRLRGREYCSQSSNSLFDSKDIPAILKAIRTRKTNGIGAYIACSEKSRYLHQPQTAPSKWRNNFGAHRCQ